MPYKPEGRALRPYDIEIVDGWNGRDMNSAETRQHIQELKDSIRARIHADPPLPALIYPVKIRYTRATGTARLIAGECRLTACRALWDEGEQLYVPAVDSEQDATEAQLLLSALTENSGQPLTQWEAGNVYRRLHVGCSLSIEAIAAHACKTKRWVSDAIELARTITATGEAVKVLLNEGKVTTGAVLHAVKEEGHEAAAVVLQEQVKEAEESAPRPAQTSIPGTEKPSRVKPVARPKKQSAREVAIRTVPSNVLTLLELADKACALILDDDVMISESQKAAKAYQKMRSK
jgi:hypothetical protein